MPVGIYMDVHIPKPITVGLRLRGVDVITAQEDGFRRAADPRLLDRSTELQRILFTHDEDFLIEASRRLKANIDFAGVIYSHQLDSPVGRCIDDLELIPNSFELVDLNGRIEYIPY